MRQLFSRVFDLGLAAATAVAVVAALPPVDASAKSLTSVPLANAFKQEIVEPPPPLAVVLDPKAAYLHEQVARGHHYRLDTDVGPIHVWTPAGYDAATAQTVIFVHGYWNDADAVWSDHRLPEQFALSGINAMFIVPEAPRGKWDTVKWRSAAGVIQSVAERIHDDQMPSGRVTVMGHSGAYRTVIPWLSDPRVDTVVLLDAAYVDVLPYRQWVVADKAKTKRFLNVSIDTIRWSNYLHRWLPGTVTMDTFPREVTTQMRDARILYIKSDIGHWPLVTDGVAIPAMLRSLGAPSVLHDQPPLGLPILLEDVQPIAAR